MKMEETPTHSTSHREVILMTLVDVQVTAHRTTCRRHTRAEITRVRTQCLINSSNNSSEHLKGRVMVAFRTKTVVNSDLSGQTAGLLPILRVTILTNNSTRSGVTPKCPPTTSKMAILRDHMAQVLLVAKAAPKTMVKKIWTPLKIQLTT